MKMIMMAKIAFRYALMLLLDGVDGFSTEKV